MLPLLVAATATNGKPSGVTAGVSLKLQTPGKAMANRWNHQPTGVIQCGRNAGTGPLAATLRIWGYSASLAMWLPLGSNSTVANRGVLNNASSITSEVDATWYHAEPVTGLGSFIRAYLQVVAISGASFAIDANLVEDGGY